MSGSYRPDNDATAGDPWNTAFLSDRDVSGQVPINYVPHPGVFLTPACFGNGTYEDSSFEECFSNLLASEFRRFIVDVYWDASNRKFRLCPVELPSRAANATAEAASMSMISDGLANLHVTSTMTRAPLQLRQLTLTNNTASNATIAGNRTVSTVSTQSATTTEPPVTTIVLPNKATLYQLGPYQCTESITLDTVVAVLNQYIAQSADTIKARLQFLIINLHVASIISEPIAPRQTLLSSQLPSSNELVSTYLSQLNTFLYTPSLLSSERENLNTSWFVRHVANHAPMLNYFTVNRLSNGDLSTTDGWPNENYVQLESGWRLLVGYGSVDSQISAYDFNKDAVTIFAPGYLQVQRNAVLGATGNVVSGCFYNNVDNSVAQINSSWAVSSIMNVDASILGNAADNLTTCGIAPVLNFTLGGQPASTGYEPYQNFGNQALFSWASGEPKNQTVAGQLTSGSRWACALMVSSNDYRGHWRVADCQQKYRVACREANQPYLWRLSTYATQYDAGEGACTGNSTFDVPRTGLENLYLYQHIRAIATSQQDSSLLDGIWTNFNSLAVDSCWVTTGPNGTCPYAESQAAIRQRTILVPTISAFIILCITALTILVKCNTNRRKSKVRKRGEGGWDYEGVPS